jgi:hypothetical protein
MTHSNRGERQGKHVLERSERRDWGTGRIRGSREYHEGNHSHHHTITKQQQQPFNHHDRRERYSTSHHHSRKREGEKERERV